METISYEDFAYQQTRFKMLTKTRPEAAKQFLKEAQAEAAARWRFYENLSEMYAAAAAGGGNGKGKAEV